MMPKTTKPLQPAETVIKSLISLRDELAMRGGDEVATQEVVFKINSCLFATYPPVGR